MKLKNDIKYQKIYICHTPYQVLISIIKKLGDSSNIDLVLCNTIPNAEFLFNNLQHTNLFNKLYIYNEIEIRKQFNELKIETKLFRTNQMIKLFEENCSIDLSVYNDIYIYNDWTTFGAYLIDKKIKFHLIEDGLDGFYYMKENFKDRVTFLNPNFTYYIKYIIKKICHIGYDFFGNSKYVIDIEVNDLKKVPKLNDKFFEVSKKSLYSSLSDKDKEFIYKIFTTEEIQNLKAKKSILLLTQPLYKDKFVDTLEVQEEVYKSIIDKYIKDYNIVIKQHPRDDFDYKKINKNVILLDRYMPAEILNFNKNVHYDKAITIKSSSIVNLDFIKEKIELGFDYLNQFNIEKEKDKE